VAQGVTQRDAAFMEDAVEAVGVGRYRYALLHAAGAAWFADGVEDSLLASFHLRQVASGVWDPLRGLPRPQDDGYPMALSH